MARRGRPKEKQLETYISETKSKMESLRTYRPEYDEIIMIYCTLLLDFSKVRKSYDREGQQAEVETAAGNPKKSATLSALENIRKDIITYSDRLMLNPKSYSQVSVDDSPPKSKLDGLFNEL